MPNITDKLNHINSRIADSAKNAGRSTSDLTLLAVSKGQPAAAISTAYSGGCRHFGENYLQEALDKQQQLHACNDIHWHFIGPIQSNKTRKIAENFDWVHSVDRLKIAQRLSDQRPEQLPPLNICLQVNIDEEESKSGISPVDLPELAQSVSQLPGLKLRGLMVIPKPRATEHEQRQPFSDAAKLLCRLKTISPELETLDTLSMGMSGDLNAAVAEGATMVRIGTDIFGPRQYPINNS